MDDDCEPRPDTLATLLSSPRAEDAGTGVLAPVVEDGEGRVLPVNRGHVRERWFFAPLVAATPEEYERDDVEIEFCSFVGPLVRTPAARRAGLPMREMFIRFEDVEYLSRLRPDQRMWMVGASRIAHHDPQPVAGADMRTMWGDYAQPTPFAQQWKRVYGFRNQLYCGVRDGYVHAGHALSYLLVQAVRTVLFHERKALSLFLLCMYAYDGWRGRFRNVPPGRWGELASGGWPPATVSRLALRYDSDVAEPPERVGAGSARRGPSPATPAA
jgi:hypothetical protein